jgi:hypothetical protein
MYSSLVTVHGKSSLTSAANKVSGVVTSSLPCPDSTIDVRRCEMLPK